MSQGSVPTKLTLARFGQLLGFHPLHLMQVRLGDADQHCTNIMFKFPWQNTDHVGRDEIYEAISETESKIESALGYRLAPSWEVDEWRQTERFFKSELVNLYSSDIRGYQQTVNADWGYLISGGIQAKELVSSNAAIVYTDLDSDLYFETATVIVNTVAIDPNEIAVFYPGHDGEDEWEIRPINVVISAGIATITFRRELVIIEDLLDLFDIEGAEAIGTDNGEFLTQVDVYRRYNDPQTQASFLWEPLAGGWCNTCNGGGCASCAYSTQTGCLVARGNPRQSIVAYHPADWNGVTNEFDSQSWAVGRQPDIVRLYYYAGLRNKSQRYISRLDPDWERTVAYMAASMLDRPPCDCAKGDWSKWRQDLTLASGTEDGMPTYREPGSNVARGLTGPTDNPFGSRRGELYAWRKVGPLILGKGLLV